MDVEILGQLPTCLGEITDLALKVSGVVLALIHAHDGQSGLLEAVRLLQADLNIRVL